MREAIVVQMERAVGAAALEAGATSEGSYLGTVLAGS